MAVQHFRKKLVILEVGIGFNTGVLRIPDDQLALQDGMQLVRVNEEKPETPFQCHDVEIIEDATDTLDTMQIASSIMQLILRDFNHEIRSCWGKSSPTNMKVSSEVAVGPSTAFSAVVIQAFQKSFSRTPSHWGISSPESLLPVSLLHIHLHDRYGLNGFSLFVDSGAVRVVIASSEALRRICNPTPFEVFATDLMALSLRTGTRTGHGVCDYLHRKRSLEVDHFIDYEGDCVEHGGAHLRKIYVRTGVLTVLINTQTDPDIKKLVTAAKETPVKLTRADSKMLVEKLGVQQDILAYQDFYG
ncbi:hypothetical protein ON010_g15726 [Phytophthora cinnamomi]|nr:hypothetical protein ON010_g15726 [Phytophthora cinnamomi]